MAVLDSTALQPDFIKLRWLEPYTSGGLNRKTFKSLPRGVYSGFVIKPGPGSFEVQINHTDPEGFGEVSGFSAGAFDPASSGWSVAVHASLQGFTSTVAILAAPGGANDFIFDLTAHKLSTVYVALFVDYKIGFATAGEVRVVEAADLDADPTLINLGRIDVPASGSISEANIIKDDPAYPRVLPFATKYKYGFMDKFQAALLEDLAAVSGTAAFTFEVIIPVDGPQTVELPPGAIFTVGGDDLWVFKNGSWKTVDVDYTETDRGDGFGEEIEYIGTLKDGDRVKFRIQKHSAVLTSTSQVLDEGALITANSIYTNYTGTGVTVFPDGPNRVNVVIPGGGGASAAKTKTNLTGLTIPIYSAVHLLADNTIEPYDPKVSGDSFYGITTQEIATSLAGGVQVGGITVGAAAAVSAGDIGDDVYVSDDGLGGITVLPPDPLFSRVIRIGQLDGPDTSVTGAASDIVFDRSRET